MKNIFQIKKNEELYKDYIKMYHSKQVRLIRNYQRLKKLSFKNKIRLINKKITAKIGDYKINRLLKPKMIKKPYYNFGNPMENVKVAVYSCITNNYDIIKQPLYVGKDTSYHIFTDNHIKNCEIWQEHLIDNKDFLNEANRYFKLNPFNVFENYDYAIYIDGNVKVLSDVTTICSIASNSCIGIAMHRHHSRNCAYDEVIACKYYKRGNLKKINTQISKYKYEGFPKAFGLCEATIIVYDLSNSIAKSISNQWWNEYIDSESKRDQISFPYILWKNGYSIEDVGDLGNDIMGNPKFLVTGHN